MHNKVCYYSQILSAHAQYLLATSSVNIIKSKSLWALMLYMGPTSTYKSRKIDHDTHDL